MVILSPTSNILKFEFQQQVLLLLVGPQNKVVFRIVRFSAEHMVSHLWLGQHLPQSAVPRPG